MASSLGAVYFTDENALGLGKLLGRREILYPGHQALPEVPLGTLDLDWMPVIAERNLVVLTRDKRIRRTLARKISSTCSSNTRLATAGDHQARTRPVGTGHESLWREAAEPQGTLGCELSARPARRRQAALPPHL